MIPNPHHGSFLTLLFGTHPQLGKQSSVRRMYGSHLLEPKLFGIIFAFCLKFKYFEDHWQQSSDEDDESPWEEGSTKNTARSNYFESRIIPFVTPAIMQCEAYANWCKNKYPTSFDRQNPKHHLTTEANTCTTLFVHVTTEPNPLKALQFLVRMKRLPHWILFVAWRDFQRENRGLGEKKSLFIPQQYAGGVHVLLFYATEYYSIEDGFQFAGLNHCDVANIEHIVFYSSEHLVKEEWMYKVCLRYVHLFMTITFVIPKDSSISPAMQMLCDPKLVCDEMHYLYGTTSVLTNFLRIIHSWRKYSWFNNIHCCLCGQFATRCDIDTFIRSDCFQQILVLQNQISEKIMMKKDTYF